MHEVMKGLRALARAPSPRSIGLLLQDKDAADRFAGALMDVWAANNRSIGRAPSPNKDFGGLWLTGDGPGRLAQAHRYEYQRSQHL